MPFSYFPKKNADIQTEFVGTNIFFRESLGVVPDIGCRPHICSQFRLGGRPIMPDKSHPIVVRIQPYTNFVLQPVQLLECTLYSV